MDSGTHMRVTHGSRTVAAALNQTQSPARQKKTPMSNQPTTSDARPAAARPDLHRFIERQFGDFITNPLFPCTVARGTAAQKRVSIHVYDDLAGSASADALLADVRAFIGDHPIAHAGFDSFAAVFAAPGLTSEAEFERLMWRLLQRLHDEDAAEHGWDPAVASDPASERFSFSLGGRAFFIVGMHPGASRHARRFAYPALVFNAHAQFEALRARGTYVPVRDRIRSNDLALQGSINPALQDHGHGSEAGQYSGRNVGEDWQCPFRPAA